ncbi:hypothetical protein ABPG74_018028 [Tetrahymena malaccensis]
MLLNDIPQKIMQQNHFYLSAPWPWREAVLIRAQAFLKILQVDQAFDVWSVLYQSIQEIKIDQLKNSRSEWAMSNQDWSNQCLLQLGGKFDFLSKECKLCFQLLYNEL